jgi:hypothetical protein
VSAAAPAKSTARPRRFDPRLSVAIDRAIEQAERAEERGDMRTARAFRRVLAQLSRDVPA